MSRALSLILSVLSVVLWPAAHAFETRASHAYILDHESGIPLYSKNGDELMVPASMTKLMTAYIVFNRIKDGRLSLEDTFTVSENAWRRGGWASGGSTMGLAIGEQVSIENLLRGVIIQSGNDACIVLAEGISGSEEAFAEDMTRLARDKGLTSATFRNSTGLDADDHRVSPRDLAFLARMIIDEHPDLYALYAEESFTWNGIRQGNRNPLLVRFPGADGLKTGHLEVSGYGLVGSAVQDGIRRIIVLNGMEDMRARADESDRMMRAAFREFDIVTVFAADSSPGAAEVYLGEATQVPLVLRDAVTVGLSRADRDALKTELVYRGPLTAPVQAGDPIGALVVTTPSGVTEYPVYAGENVAKKGFWGRVIVGLQSVLTGA